jgi:hypothetical protein
MPEYELTRHGVPAPPGMGAKCEAFKGGQIAKKGEFGFVIKYLVIP